VPAAQSEGVDVPAPQNLPAGHAGQSAAWVAPVVSDGKLYLRSENWLVCLDLQNAVKAKSAEDGKVSGD